MEDSEARMRLDGVESRMSNLEESVKKAAETLIPKVNALLAARSEEQATSDSRNSTTARVSTSLVEMAKLGDYEALLGLLADPGIDIQKNPQRNENGDTPLHEAATEGHVKAVMVLLGAGARINALGSQLRTPLHCAAAQGHLAVAQRLLIAGAQVDAKDAEGATPLGLAAEQGRWDLVKLLSQKGAKPNEEELFVAMENGHWNLVKCLVEEGKLPVDMCNKEGDPLIVLAAKAKRWRMVELLLEKGASATKCKYAKESALVWASEDGQADAVRHLLLRGASSNTGQVENALIKAKNAVVVWAFVDVVRDKIQGQIGGLGLVHAGFDGRLEPMLALLKAGVNINATDSANGTALYFAACKGRLACVRELLRRGADVNIKHKNAGNTPLHEASLKGHVECVRALLDAGASRTEKNKEGKTPLEVARWNDVRVILNRG